MQWNLLEKMSFLIMNKLNQPCSRRRFCLRLIILSWLVWSMYFKLIPRFSLLWNSSEVVNFSCILEKQDSFLNLEPNFMHLLLLLPLDIYIQKKLSTETWSQKIYWWAKMAIYAWLILVSLKSWNRTNRPTHSVVHLNIWLQRFLMKKAMVSQSIGGHLVFLHMRWLLVSHHSTQVVQTIRKCMIWSRLNPFSSQMLKSMVLLWVKIAKILYLFY